MGGEESRLRKTSFSVDSMYGTGKKDQPAGWKVQSSADREQSVQQYVVDKAISKLTSGASNDTLDVSMLESMVGAAVTRHVLTRVDAKVERNSEDSPQTAKIDHDALAALIKSCFNGTDRDVVALFADSMGFLKTGDIACLLEAAAAASAVDIEKGFSDKVVASVVNGSSSVDVTDVVMWIGTNCYRMLPALKSRVVDCFRGVEHQVAPFDCPADTILSKSEVWFVASAFPSLYVNERGTGVCWDALYNSKSDGLSTSNFAAKVSGYAGAAVLVIESDDERIFVVGLDQGFNESSKHFGGEKSCIVQVFPEVAVCDSGGELVYFQLRNRQLRRGLTLGRPGSTPILSVDSGFDNVVNLEFWATGSPKALARLADQKKWEKKQIEKNKHVPLPGKWEDNPDRAILEMAGITVSHPQERVGD